jgi:hypothetical protein
MIGRRPPLGWTALAVALAGCAGGPSPISDGGTVPDTGADTARVDVPASDAAVDAPADAPSDGPPADGPAVETGPPADAPSAADASDGAPHVDGPLPSAVCLTQPTPSCSNGTRDGDEVDSDCGGSCPRCLVAAACTANRDCATNRCVSARCGTVPAACSDSQKNGDESDIDCGGAECAPCLDGRACRQGADCAGLSCAGVCRTPTLLTIDIGGQGRVTSGELEIDCTSTCSVRIPSHVRKFSMTATPAAGSRGPSWVICGKFALSDTQCEPHWFGSTPPGYPQVVDVNNKLTLSWESYEEAKIPGRIRVGFVDTTRVIEQWDRVWVSDVSNLESPPPRVVLDGAGNTLFATLMLGNGTFGGVASSGPTNVLGLMMGKVSAIGEVTWLQRYPSINSVAAIALDASGGPVVAGRANPDMTTLGGPALTDCAQKAATAATSYVARYGPGGDHRWSRCLPGTVKGTVVDGQGQVVLAGTTPGGAWDFGDGVSGTGAAGFIVRLAAADGRAIAIRTFAGAEPQGLAATPDGRLVVLGEHRAEVDLGGGPLRLSGSGGDFHVASFTGELAHTWSRAFAGAVTMADDWAPLAPLADGGILLAGTSVWPSGFGCSTSQPYGRFLARLDASGEPLWFREVKTQNIRLSMAAGRDLFAVTGSCPHLAPCDFGGGPLPLFGPGPNFENDFLVLYSLDGQPVWSSHLDLGLLQRAGRLGAGHATVAMDPDGNLSVLSHTLTRLRP